jgi:hypothetical protein
MSHDGPFKTQYIVRGVLQIAKVSLAQSRGTEAFHPAFISGVMAARRSLTASEASGPTEFTPFVIEEGNVQWLMYIADPMS